MANCPALIGLSRSITNSSSDCITNADWNVLASGVNSARDTFQPYFATAEALAVCSPVYLTSTGAVTGTGSSGCFLIGSHLGSGRVSTVSPVLCITIGEAVSPCDTLAYDTVSDSVIQSPTGSLVALEAGAAGACICVMDIGTQTPIELRRTEVVDFVNSNANPNTLRTYLFDTVVEDGLLAASLPNGLVIPCDGTYHLSASILVDSSYNDAINYWIVPTLNTFVNIAWERFSDNVIAGGPPIGVDTQHTFSRSFTFSAGDVIGLNVFLRGAGANVPIREARLVLTGLEC